MTKQESLFLCHNLTVHAQLLAKILYAAKGLSELTVIFLSFRTDRSGQCSLIRVYTVCNSGCIFWMHYSEEKSSCSTFGVITANVLGVRNFRIFTVLLFMLVNQRSSAYYENPQVNKVSLQNITYMGKN